MKTPLLPWFILWVTIPIIIFFLFILPAHASDGPFYQRGQEGWFWYQVIPEPAEDEEPIKPKSSVVEPTKNELKPFSAAWFRGHMQSFMDKAIDEPSTENVRAYLYLQCVMIDKGTLLADVSQQVVMGEPVLDEISRRLLATYAANRMDREAGAQRDVALGEVAKRAGLFFFYRSDCPYCHAQAPIIESMALNYGFEVFAIAVDGLPLPGGEFPNYKVDSGQAQSLSVTTVPAVFLVDTPNVITPIGQGKAPKLTKLNGNKVTIEHLIHGGNVAMYRYDTVTQDGCLNPTITNVTLTGLSTQVENLLLGTGSSNGIIFKFARNTSTASTTEKAFMTSATASTGGMIRTLSALNEGAAGSFASRAAPFIAVEMAWALVEDMLNATRSTSGVEDHAYAKLLTEDLERARRQINEE